MSWTDERVEALKTMWGEGKSASQIAKTLGGVTRNAVIGKVHRLGLSNRAAAKPAAKEAEPAAARPEAAEPAAAPARPAARAETPARPAAPEPQPEPAAAAAPAAPVKETPRRPAPTAGQPHPPAVSEVSDEARRSLEEVEKKARKIHLLELTERTCKWPIGDPATDDFYFCGLPAHPGKPYCETHVSIAFQPMSARRDRSRSR